MAKKDFTHKIDDLGRVLVPQELRKPLGWEIGDTVSLYRLKDSVIVNLEKKKDLCSDSGSE